MKNKLIGYAVVCFILIGLTSFVTIKIMKKSEIEVVHDNIHYVKYDENDWRFHVSQEEYDKYMEIYDELCAITADTEKFKAAAINELENYGVSGEVVYGFSHAYGDLGEDDVYKLLKGFETEIYFDDNIVVFSINHPKGDGMSEKYSIIYSKNNDTAKILDFDHYYLLLVKGESVFIGIIDPYHIIYNYIIEG